MSSTEHRDESPRRLSNDAELCNGGGERPATPNTLTIVNDGRREGIALCLSLVIRK